MELWIFTCGRVLRNGTGIDFSAEGPFKKGKGATYLINYRYSTLGLLSSMGVALGDEKITFQDLSFNVSIPFKDKARLTFFGMGGNSSNRFDAKDSTEWEFDKDSQNIDYLAKVGAVGTTFRFALGKNVVWNTTAVASEQDQQREAEYLFYEPMIRIFKQEVSLYERKLSCVSYVRGAIGARTTYRIGGSTMQRTLTKNFDAFDESNGWLLRPYAEVSHDITERLRATLGLAYSYYTPNASDVLEPRIALSWRTYKGRTLTLSAGQRGQLPKVQLFPTYPFRGDNTAIGITRSQEIVLAYDHPFNPFLVLHGEAYVQQQLHVPVGVLYYYGYSSYAHTSLVNGWDDQYYVPLSPTGTAINKGVELALSHTLHHNFFYQVNGTWVDATYTDITGATHNSRWNTNGMGNVIVGREFVKEKEGVKRTWGVNARVNVTGGQRYTAYLNNYTELGKPFAAQYPTTYRIDLRIYLKRERKAHTGMWSLDLLNATNAQNVSYRYFDNRKQEFITKYQLGLISNLSYLI